MSTPTSSPTCWRRGVAPSKKPVFRSWDVSPAMDAAMATTQPTVRAPALPMSPVQPSSKKTVAVSNSVAMVIPLVGLEVTPTRPTMRDDTVTKKKAQITTSSAATVRAPVPGS